MTHPEAALQCPDDESLLEFAAGTLAPARQAELEAHVSECTTCCEVLAEVATGGRPEHNVPLVVP